MIFDMLLLTSAFASACSQVCFSDYACKACYGPNAFCSGGGDGQRGFCATTQLTMFRGGRRLEGEPGNFQEFPQGPPNGRPQGPPNGPPRGPPNGQPRGPMPPKPDNDVDTYWDNFWDNLGVTAFLDGAADVWDGAVSLWDSLFGERRLDDDSETAVDASTADESEEEASTLETRLEKAGLSGDDQRRRLSIRPPGPPIQPIQHCRTNRNCGWGQECSASGGFCVEKGGGFYGARCTHEDHCYHVGYYCTGYSAPPGGRPKIGHCEHKKADNASCQYDEECKSGYCWYDHNGYGTCEPDEATGTFF